MNLRCECGNDAFKAKKVTLVLLDVPCEITEDGPQYDDTEAEQAEGWDYNQESRVTCTSCGKQYDIAKDGGANICLEPVSEDRRSNDREGFGSRVAEAGGWYGVAGLVAGVCGKGLLGEARVPRRATPCTRSDEAGRDKHGHGAHYVLGLPAGSRADHPIQPLLRLRASAADAAHDE